MFDLLSLSYRKHVLNVIFSLYSYHYILQLIHSLSSLIKNQHYRHTTGFYVLVPRMFIACQNLFHIIPLND